MVANAGSMQKPLPLCETVSRVTAEEFKNFGVHVDEFYGKLADSPEIMSLANAANVIIYEGHMAYQDLIDVPFARRTTTPDTYFEEELDELEGGGTEPDPTGPRRTRAAARRAVAPEPPPRPARGGRAGLEPAAGAVGGSADRDRAELRLAGRAAACGGSTSWAA